MAPHAHCANEVQAFNWSQVHFVCRTFRVDHEDVCEAIARKGCIEVMDIQRFTKDRLAQGYYKTVALSPSNVQTPLPVNPEWIPQIFKATVHKLFGTTYMQENKHQADIGVEFGASTSLNAFKIPSSSYVSLLDVVRQSRRA